MAEICTEAFHKLRDWLLQGAGTCFASASDINFARIGFGIVLATVAQNGWIGTALADSAPDDPDVVAAVRGCAAHVAERAGPDGWTYYNQCADIPPDADDLGLAMSLLAAAQWPDRRALLAGPLQLLRSNTLGPGLFRTWLCHEGEASMLDTRWAAGAAPVHPDVVANIAWALMADGHVDWETDVRAAMDWLAQDPIGHLDANHWYYSDGYVAFLMMRLFRDCPVHWPEHRPAVSAMDALANHLRRGQASDGSWPQDREPVARQILKRSRTDKLEKSCLETGWRVAALRECQRATDDEAIRAAQSFLELSQMEDAGYPAEPFFETVAAQPYGSREVTAAAALRALAPRPRARLHL
jgi:hypothetical protein